MKRLLTLSVCCMSMLFLIGCSKQSNAPKYDRTPYAVYVYDGSKEIVLYDNPKQASVNGRSGDWTATTMMRLPGEEWPTNIPTHYVVRYGDEVCVISPSRGLVFFGDTQDDAWRNYNNEYKWKDCHRKL